MVSEAGAISKLDPLGRQVYDALLHVVRQFGAVQAEEKKTSIHLVARTAFAGVHPRKSGILLNIRTDAPIQSDRIRKLEQVSAKRFHNELLIASPTELDGDVVGWLRAAYQLSAGAE